MPTKLLGRAYARLALLTICLLLLASVIFDLFATQKRHASASMDVVLSTNELEHNSHDHDHGHDHGHDHRTRSVAHASIGKVSMVYGDPEPVYERGLRLHNLHNQRFGYPMFLLTSKTLPEYWSKPAYILKVLLSEMEKPEGERLKWLMWVDADVVLMNQNIPLEIFVPAEGRSDVHLLVTDDYHGLNNGVFFIRVHVWSVWLMSAVTSIKVYNQDIDLRFGDQSALEILIKKETFKIYVRHVPQHWFNGYAGSRGKPDPLPTVPDKRPEFPSNAKDGALLVHFPAHYAIRARRMNLWLNEAELHRSPWEVPLNETYYPAEIEQYWSQDTLLEEAIWKAEKRRRQKERAREKEAAAHQALYEQQLALEVERMEAAKIEAEGREQEAERQSLEPEHPLQPEPQGKRHWWSLS